MAYVSTTGDTYHDRRRCRRLHATGGRIRRVDDAGDRDACSHCVDGDGETDAERDIGGYIDMGVGPWCEGYEGDHVGQHASSAHPDEWAAYRDR
jgi:hypothetical protein